MAFPINVNDVRRTVLPSNGTTEISVDFPFEKEEWLTVKKYDGSSETTLALTTNYTTSGEGLETGGKIILVTPANGTDIYSIALDIPVQRLSDYQKRGSMKSEVINLDFDRVIQICQRIGAKVDRALHRRDTDTSSTDLLMPEPPASASYMQLNSDGTVSLTGTAPTVTPTYTFILPEDYGAAGDNATDDTVALQAAEDAATALASSTGKAVGLLLSGTYLVSDSIQKKANVNWWGHGAIKHVDYDASPTLTVTTQFALVYASGVSDWRIDGIRFFSIPHSAVISNALPRKGGDSPLPGNWNSAIDADDCDRWVVKDCTFKGFSQAIKYSECNNFRIDDNYLDDESGYTVASMIAETYTKGYSQSGTFGIGTLHEGTPQPKSSDFSINNNDILTPGLDSGIRALSQTYDEAPGVVEGNRIFGAGGPGIQIYRGTYVDGGSAPTYDARLVVQGNLIYGTWEQGIYIRGVVGVLVDGNVLVEPGKQGDNGDGSVGGIVTRVNPFSTDFSGTFTSQATLSSKAGVEICNNIVINPGDAADCDGGIQVRVSWCHCHDNVIVRDEKTYTSKVGAGILTSNEQEEGVYIEHNRIFNFATGINFVGGLGDAGEEEAVVSHNHILRTDTGINVNSYRWNGVRIDHNYVKDATTTAIKLRNSPRSRIEHNEIIDCGEGLHLMSGSLASNIPHLMTGGTTPASVTKRQGATVIVRANTFYGVTTPHERSETATNDTTFQGRCLIWEDDVVDGKTIDGNAYSGASYSNFPRTWHVGDIIRNTTIAAATLHSSICTVAGTGGTNTVSTTCTTNGTTAVSAVADFDGIGPGMYVDIDGEVVYIKSMDPAAGTLVVDPALVSSGASKVLQDTAPTFVNLLTVGAT